MPATDIQKHNKSWTEIPDNVDFEAGSGWGWGKWNFANYCLTHCYEVNGEVVEDEYRLPRCFGLMLEREREHGKEKLQRQFRELLGS